MVTSQNSARLSDVENKCVVVQLPAELKLSREVYMIQIQQNPTVMSRSQHGEKPYIHILSQYMVSRGDRHKTLLCSKEIPFKFPC